MLVVRVVVNEAEVVKYVTGKERSVACDFNGFERSMKGQARDEVLLHMLRYITRDACPVENTAATPARITHQSHTYICCVVVHCSIDLHSLDIVS
jgi:hypothetical protein